MLLRLGLETQQHHAVADADRIAVMEASSPADYRAQLARILGFEAPVESALAHLLEAALLRERTKAHWLRRDLMALGLEAQAVECIPRYPARITSIAQALGWLFVIERHTLMSGLIRRQLEHRFDQLLCGATSYLAACGDTPGARFRSLCEALDEHGSQHATHPTLIVAAACEAFRAQRQWYAPVQERETRVASVLTVAVSGS